MDGAPKTQDPMPVAAKTATRVAFTPQAKTPLVGRLVLPSGSPAEGVEVRLEGWKPWRVFEEPTDGPATWDEVVTKTGTDGRFAFEADVPAGFFFDLSAHEPGYAPIDRRLDELDPDARLDLGTIELVAGGAIEVSIRDARGLPLVGGWQVTGKPAAGNAPELGRWVSCQGEPDPARGTWLIRDLPPGKNNVTAWSALAEELTAAVDVTAGEVTPCELTYSGPNLATRISVATSTSPIYPVGPDPAHVGLIGAALDAPRVSERATPFGECLFHDVPPGEYTLQIDDPRFERWEQTGVTPGHAVRAQLTGSAALRITVIDRKTRTSVEGFKIKLRCENVNFGPDEFELGSGELDATGARAFASLIPMTYTLFLDVPGYASVMEKLEALAPGEERALTFEVTPNERLRGVVVDTSGEPVSGAPVEVYRESALDGVSDWWTFWGASERQAQRLGSTVTDELGRWSLDAPTNSPFVLRAVAGSALHVLETVPPGAATGPDGVRLVLPRGTFVHGRVLAPPDADVTQLRVRAGVSAFTPDMRASEWELGLDAFLETTPAPDGSYRLGPFGSGTLQVTLVRGAKDERGAPLAPATLISTRCTPEPTGEASVDFDMRTSWPGELALTLTGSGEPLGATTIMLRPRNEANGRSWISAMSDLHGRLTVAPLAGTYAIEVAGPVLWWSLTSTADVEVRAGEMRELTLDFPIRRAELHLVDSETAAPLATQRVRLYLTSNGGEVRLLERTTDARGRLELLAPVGPLWIERSPEGSAPIVFAKAAQNPETGEPLTEADLNGRVRIEWTASGPSPAELAVPKE